jgi:hypothetical protein
MKIHDLGIPIIVLAVAIITGLTAHNFQAAGKLAGNHSGSVFRNDIRSTQRSTQESSISNQSRTQRTLKSAGPSTAPLAKVPAPLAKVPAPLAKVQSKGPEWYVAPEGNSLGEGTLDSPWDLPTALAGGPSRSQVKPGDTIWLRGGLYAGTFVSTLTGMPEAPIIVRQYPGERAIIDRAGVSSAKQPALKVRGSWVWFWGFEIMNSHPDRSRTSPYSGSVEAWRGSGADVYAPNVKFISMVFHDNGHGIWDKEDMTEVNGCLFYYNGNNKREHAMYIGNSNGTKYIVDNIVFAQGGYGILSHSDSTSSSQVGLHIEGNASFNNGILTLDDQTTGNIQVGGVAGVSAERITIRSNLVYNSPANPISKNNGIRLGYEDTGNKNVTVVDNYIVSRIPLRVLWWQNVQSSGNTIYSRGNSAELTMPTGVSPSAYRWDLNTYISGRKGGPIFVKDDSTQSFVGWQESTGLDRNSRVEQNASFLPSGVKTFIRANTYEAGRANIVVYNWDLRTSVAVDVSSVLSVGASYEVRDAQNYFGEPVVRGIYDGTPINLPMKLTRIAQPVGNVERAPVHTEADFNVFVLQQVSTPPSAK